MQHPRERGSRPRPRRTICVTREIRNPHHAPEIKDELIRAIRQPPWGSLGRRPRTSTPSATVPSSPAVHGIRPDRVGGQAYDPLRWTIRVATTTSIVRVGGSCDVGNVQASGEPAKRPFRAASPRPASGERRAASMIRCRGRLTQPGNHNRPCRWILRIEQRLRPVLAGGKTPTAGPGRGLAKTEARQDRSPARPKPGKAEARQGRSPARPKPGKTEARQGRSPARPKPGKTEARQDRSPARPDLQPKAETRARGGRAITASPPLTATNDLRDR
jgi:hypothetical protein